MLHLTQLCGFILNWTTATSKKNLFSDMSTPKPTDVFSVWIHVYRQAQKRGIEL